MKPSAAWRVWLYWLVPPVFTIWVYWSGLRSWFVADDFVWLGLLNKVHGWPDLSRAIFQPTVQGTLRPWSDRVFFLLFRTLFDFDAFPYHAWIFATQIAAGVVLMSIVRRLTGSRTAGFLAPIFWTGNAVLLMTMAWACLYKDILCSLSMLLAFYFLLRFIETGETRFNVYQWTAFVLGFGAMETNVVYPAIAIGYTVLCAPRFVRKTLPMAIGSILYLALSYRFVPKAAAGPYRMHIDRYLPVTLLKYWAVALDPTSRREDYWPNPALPAILTVAIAALVILRWRRGDRLPAFFLCWFLAAIAPVLPLRDQFQPYYLTVAAIGLAMLAAHAFALAWQYPRLWSRAVVLGVALAVFVSSILLSRRESRVWRSRGLRAEAVVLGARDIHDRHPDWIIFLDRVDTRLFWDVFPDEAFRAAQAPAVYLTPSTAARIAQLRPAPEPAKYALAIGSIPDLDRTIVFDASVTPMRDITRAYINSLTDLSQLPTRIELASSLFDSFLGGVWFQPEAGFRWMGKQASVRLASPRSAGQALHMVAHCSPELLAAGPLMFQVSVNGAALPPVNLRPGRQELSFPLPEGGSKHDLTVGLQISRTFHPPGDDRDLGLPIVSIEIR